MDLKTALGYTGDSYAAKVNRAAGWRVPRFQPPRSLPGWKRALARVHGDLLGAEHHMAQDFEGRFIKRYSNASMYPGSGTWHLAIRFQYTRFLTVLRAAQARYPGEHFGYPEG